MIYIITALAVEAKPFINHFKLKKTGYNFFREYASDDITLLISGIGKINSACAVADLLTRHKVCSSDIIINLGICGSADAQCKKGEWFLVNKIVDDDTKRAYYPDMIVRHTMSEADIRSYSMPVYTGNLTQQEKLVDMEAAGFFQAALRYLGPHNIYVIKVVSDFLNEVHLSKDFVQQIITSKLECFDELICNIKKVTAVLKKQPLTEKEQQLLQHIGQNLKLTVSQMHLLKDWAINYKIRTHDCLDLLLPYCYKRVRTKHERNQLFECIKQQLIK